MGEAPAQRQGPRVGIGIRQLFPRLAAVDSARPLALVGLWIAAALVVGRNLDQGWIAHDDGSFAQSAERVLGGQLPHRDFVELYTGGMTFLNAGVFALLGHDLIWLRLPIFVLFLAYIPCTYFIARRFVRPSVAAVVALLATSWSLPIYPAAIPSWYLLYFAVFGIAALFCHLDTGHARWLVVAGVFGGLSISFKLVGVWYVLAVLLYLVFVEQEEHSAHVGETGSATRYSTLVIGLATAAAGAVAVLLASHVGSAEVVNFLLPIALLCALLGWFEVRRSGSAPWRVRLPFLVRLAGPFLAGVVLPIAAVASPYLVTGSLATFVRGVLIEPQSRLDFSYLSTPSALSLIWAIPIAAALVVRRRQRPPTRRRLDVAIATAVAFILVTSSSVPSYVFLWNSARALAPVIVVVGCAVLLIGWRRGDRGRDVRPLLLLLLVAAFVSLVQFPFGASVYFVYAAPLFALAGVAVVQHARAGDGLLPVTLLAVYMLFGFAWLDRGAIGTLGVAFHPAREHVVLNRDVASIRVTPEQRAVYDKAVGLLERHGEGRFIFAGPDAPELYYLTRRENPTRALFDFLDASDSARGTRLLNVLRRRSVTAIAINLRPDFSDPLEAATVRTLRTLYPHHARAGRFDIRWRS
jgi:hypothetical protein